MSSNIIFSTIMFSNSVPNAPFEGDDMTIWDPHQYDAVRISTSSNAQALWKRDNTRGM
jgi:hypothetical protein